MTDKGWEALSNQGVAAAGVVYFLALLAYAVQWAALRDVPVRQPVAVGGAGGDTMVEDVPAVPEEKSHRTEMAGRLGVLLVAIGALAHFIALLGRGIKRVHLANRTIARAEALARQFGPKVSPVSWDGLDAVLPRARLLVNTTSLGMHGQPPLGVDVAGLPDGAVVADLVYVPLVTPLLAVATARGLKTADGLGMLLHQAVRGFELWFGRRPQVTAELRALLEADLTKT